MSDISGSENAVVLEKAPPSSSLNPFVLIRRLYDWTLHWAETPYGVPALAALAFAESSFFPVPPDVLLIALCLGIPARSFRFALVCTAFSVVGGMGGYLIGFVVWHQVSEFFFSYVFSRELFETVGRMYGENAFWAVFTAGLTPIPYKVFTVAAGVFEIDFVAFLVASVLGRAGRFFAVAALIRVFGPPIRDFIDKYFNLLSIAFVILLAGGFLIIKWLT